MILTPCLIRCPIANPVEMIQLYDIEKEFLRTLTERTPVKAFLPPQTFDSLHKQGAAVPYDNKGFERVAEDELMKLQVASVLVWFST